MNESTCPRCEALEAELAVTRADRDRLQAELTSMRGRDPTLPQGDLLGAIRAIAEAAGPLNTDEDEDECDRLRAEVARLTDENAGLRRQLARGEGAGP